MLSTENGGELKGLEFSFIDKEKDDCKATKAACIEKNGKKTTFDGVRAKSAT